MSKLIECVNCKNMYDCERTYLGGCTDGEEWADSCDTSAVQSKKTMVTAPLKKLSRLIGSKWFLSLDQLAARSGVAKDTIRKAMADEPVLPRYEKKLRDFLENYKGEGDEDSKLENIKKVLCDCGAVIEDCPKEKGIDIDCDDYRIDFIRKQTAREIVGILKGYNYDGEIDELISIIGKRYGLEGKSNG